VSSPSIAPAPDELLFDVEDRCNRAVAVINFSVLEIEGGTMIDDPEQGADRRRAIGAALERIAEELAALSERALAARSDALEAMELRIIEAGNRKGGAA
jgi:hypothetical protein